ncbi:MAG: response regulator [bacterium]|nr:response regulator [bacterium]
MAEKTILVVDDDPSVLIYLEQILKDEGYRVLTAPQAEVALQLLEVERPDLLVLDIEMPGMSGLELLERIRRKKETAKIPAVFLTVKDTPSDEIKGLREGGVDYLGKDVLTPDRVEILRYRFRNLFALQENERLKGMLATIVAANHEINNPLMVIQGGADLLRLKGIVADHPEGGPVVERMGRACKKIANVLQRIATLTTWEVKPYLDGIEMLDLKTKEAVSE